MNSTQGMTTVYFDGLCRLCSSEINHYRKQPGAERLAFVDITSSGFDAANEGLDPVQVHRVMHVRSRDGQLHTKVSAFIEIWRNLPRYKRLAQIASRPAVTKLLAVGYEAFAFVRPYLPRKKDACAESPYCEAKSAS